MMAETEREPLVEAREWLKGEVNTVESLIAQMPPESQEMYRASSAPHALHAALDEQEKALSEYEAAVMGTLTRLPNHWQQYRDLLELGPGIQAARRLGREALDRRLDDV